MGLVYGYAYRVDASGQMLDGGRPFGEVMPATLSQVEALLIRNPVPTLSAVFRRTCISSLGGFDEAFVGIADRDVVAYRESLESCVSARASRVLSRIH